MKIKRLAKTSLKSIAFKLRKMSTDFGGGKKVKEVKSLLTGYGTSCVRYEITVKPKN